ncbi:MAG: ABC transporter permease [Thermoplasmatota archaeon]|nr:ABC transporter permease [Halobacteriales archaeon]
MDALPRNGRVGVMVWRREVMRHLRSPGRTLGALVQPILFVFVLGYGLSPTVDKVGGVPFSHFVFPGAVALSVASTAIFAAASTVRDREFGFLREMLVAPVWRSTILTGKILGAATVATLQGILVLAIAPLVGLRLAAPNLAAALAVCMVTGLVMAGLGTWVAAGVRRIEGFQGMVQFVLFPMVFLSGALFPLDRLPGWLALLTRLDPLTYAVDPMRRVLLQGQGERAALDAVSLLGGGIGVPHELAILGFITALCAGGAVWELTRRE